jgi:hypothetical protein
MFIVLLVMTCTAFLAWVVPRGQSNSFPPPNTPTVQPSNTPTAIPDKELVLHIPQKALIKNYVTVSAEAPVGTSCELIYVSPSGETRQTTVTADASGLCTWKWKIGEAEGKGDGRLIFTVGDITETHFIQILSSF